MKLLSEPLPIPIPIPVKSDKPLEEPEPARYLYGTRQKFIRDRLRENGTWLVSQFIGGEHPRYIAASLGVSEESVRRRLRSHDLFRTGGSKGRPAR